MCAAAALAVLVVLRYLSVIVLPVMFALTIAPALTPVARRLRKRLGRPAAALSLLQPQLPSPFCSRNYPRALFGGLLIAAAIYLVVTLVASIVVPTDRLAWSSGPLLEVVQIGPMSLPTGCSPRSLFSCWPTAR